MQTSIDIYCYYNTRLAKTEAPQIPSINVMLPTPVAEAAPALSGT